MAEFKLGRIRFVWKGAWASATTYIKDDVIRYGGKTYICTLGHTSTSNFYTDASTSWNLASDGQAWKGAWTGTTYYKIGDTVSWGGQVYIANTGHTSQTYLEDDLSKWDVFASQFSWKNAWTTSTYYKIGDIVKYGGTVYRCKTSHTSNASATLAAGGLEADQSKWDVVNQSFDYKGVWATGIRYKVNDVVKSGAGLWICTALNLSGASWSGDNAYWSRFVEGLEFLSTYNSATAYVPGDVVTYGGYSYVALTNTTNQTPSTTPSVWSLLSTGFNFRNDYAGATAYKTGDVVRLDGYTYICTADSTGNQPPNTSYWQQLNPGYKWLGTWTTATGYVLGDTLKYSNNTYVCVLGHTSATGNRPDNDLSGTYWNLMSGGAETLVMTTQGDITFYSGSGPARLPIGTDGQVLTVSGNTLVWNTFGDISNIFYVAPTGTDTTTNGQGTTLDKPFATIKYACDYVRNGVNFTQASYLLTQNANWLTREMYQYMVYRKTNNLTPFTTSSTFDETKSIRDAKLLIDAISQDLTRISNANTVGATFAYFATSTTFYNATVTSEMPYFISGLTYLKSLFSNALNKTAPSSNYQTLTSYTPTVSQQTPGGYTAESGAVTAVNNLIDIVINALTASSTAGIPLPTTGQTTTIFVKTGTYSEILPIIIPENTAIVGDELRGTIIQPTTGYTTSNFFYMRNGSGLRNCSLQGLSGTLGSANSYGTQRPTAGAYVSLDPGTGPDDPTVWIYKRSPYVQNVTTFGTAAIGMKVDGSLHNGGNKSIVANDFTQVIDNGIGAWVTNNARAELVSVFTYYSHIGYLAENGGKIRATNGNNSYGKYGSVSEYVDSTETPITATVNNRAAQAQVGYTFTNGSQIYRLEYSNAGNAYPNSGTTFTFNSAAGINAVAVGDETRDNGVFENRMLTTGTGYVTATNTAQSGGTTSIIIAASDTAISAAYLGMRMIITSGLGVGQQAYIAYYSSGTKTAYLAKESFTTVTASAVTASGAKITVPSTTSFYTNMPIIFTGTTIGGFSLGTVYYVQSVLSSTQIAISASSGGPVISSGLADASGSTMIINAAGWDHVVVGTAIAGTLDTTTTYVIEPRVTFSAPSYATTSRTMPASTTWSSSTYSSGRFVAVSNAGGNSAYSVDGVNWTAMTGLPSNYFVGVAGGVISSTNTFATIAGGTSASSVAYYSTNGTSWSVGSALTSAAWQALTFGNGRFVAVSNGTTSAWSTNGSAWNVGGTLPANTVWTSVAYGTGPALFVAVSGGTVLSTSAAYSVDGSSWTAATLPQSAYWTSVAWGNGRFVAVAQGGQQTAYSLDGINWTTPATVLPAVYAWKNIAYGQGNFLATASILTPTINATYTGSNQIALSSSAGMATGQTWVPTSVTQTTTATATTNATATLSSTSIIGIGGALNVLTPGMANQGTMATGMIVDSTYLYSGTAGTQRAQNLAITNVSGSGATVTITYTAPTQPLSNIVISDTVGNFTCSNTTKLLVGQTIIVSGTFGGTGSISGYSSPTTYYIIKTNGSTSFQLSTTATGGPVTTVAGTPSAVTFAYQQPAPFVVGQSISVKGVNPIAYNGTYTVTGTPTTTQVQFTSTTTTAYVSGGTVFSTPLYITGSNTFASTGSNISGTTLTIGTVTSGTVAIGQTLTGTTFSNNYAEVKGSNLSLQGTNTGTPAAGMYIGGPNVNNNVTISAANSSTFFGSIAAGTTVTFTASIAPVSTTDAGLGGIMSVTSVPSGTGIVVGYVLSGTGVVGGTYVSANVSGTATSNPSSWIVNISQTVSSTTITATPVTLNVTGVGVGTIVPGTVVGWTGGFSAQNLSISNISGNGISATVTFSSAQTYAPFAVGQSITITGNGNSNFNGTFNVTGCTTTIATFSSSTNATASGGTVVSAGTFVTANGTGSGGTGTYYVSPAPTASVSAGTSFTGLAYTLNAPTLSSVVISGTGGTFTCASANLAVGMTVTITGTLGGSGSITGYATGTTYYIIATNGSTSFTLGTAPAPYASPVTTTAGTPTGLTYTLNNISYQNNSIVGNSITGYITANLSGSGNGSTWTVSSALAPTGNIAISGLSYTLSASQSVAAGPISGTNNLVTVGSTTGMTVGESFNMTGTSIGGLVPSSFTLSGVTITGTAGQFSCTASTLAIGQKITISGTLGGTGTITGYSTPTTYYIIATNGTTAFTLSTTAPWQGGAGVVTTAGTPTGLTYTVDGTYYVNEVVSATQVALSTSYLGPNAPLSTATSGSLSVTAGSYVGGLTSGNTYYVASINSATNEITVSANSSLTPVTTITGNAGGSWTSTTGAGAAASSPDGINWTSRTIANSGWSSLTFGNTSTTFTGSITGTTLTVTSAPSGCGITTGIVLNGIGVIAGTTITGNLSGSQFSSSSTWTVSNNHSTATGSITITSASPLWIAIAGNTASTSALSIPNFTQAQARAKIASGQLASFNIYEPGSGYLTPPTITIGDPNVTSAATYQVRTGIGVLSSPTFTNRGTAYTTATTTITGTGYADTYQNSQYMNVSGMTLVPTAGSNVQFAGNSTYYKLVSVSSLAGSAGNYSATLQISPNMTIPLSPVHGVAITMRIMYSQVRLTGHDFLSVGTGTISTTNYPGTPTQSAVSAQQTVESGGGRVFYTATDQDGNFNVGNLFTVQQSTGIATLNANAFNLSGLQTLQLGSVSLGSSNTTISQFSTDGTFTANSDNIVPTQKAIRTYIASQIGGGGSTVNVNTLVAGTIQITGSNISNTANTAINIKNKANFTQGVDGSPLALNYFLLR